MNLDGQGNSRISTGIRFFDHMLDLVARHGAGGIRSWREIAALDRLHMNAAVGMAVYKGVLR